MRLSDYDKVRELRSELDSADYVLEQFEKEDRLTFPVFVASSERAVHVAHLLPVEKSVAVSAARRHREKIADQLRSLGVTLD